jgi:lysophospholipase L1-like esterase
MTSPDGHKTFDAALETGEPVAPELREIRTFTALGDSFTAGTGSERGTCWADRLATTLRAERRDLLYRNLAFEGATTSDLLEQVTHAIELEPDLATVICGANDVFESVRPRPDEIAGRLAEACDRLRESVSGTLIVTATVPERWRFLTLGPRTRARVTSGIEGLNARIRAIAVDRQIPCLDVAAHPGLSESDNFCRDGLHPSALGHTRAAFAFAALLRAHTGSNSWVESR